MLLETKNISKCFNEQSIIKNINISLDKNEIVCILGTSGVGKTTLFNIIAGLLKPDNGDVYLKNENITGQSGRISYMLQKDLLLPYKTVLDNVALPLLIKKTPKKEAHTEAFGFFPAFGLSGFEKKYPNQLSGGMRQRAAFLRTYLSSDRSLSDNETSVTLLDEPFSALDSITKTTMHYWYLDVVRKMNISTLFITHDIDEAILLSNRIYILSGMPGKITDEIFLGNKPSEIENLKNFMLYGEFLEYKRMITGRL